MSRNTSHWIWYIFPQLLGLGQSAKCLKFDIPSGQDACDFLKDKQLFNNYLELVRIVHFQLIAGYPLKSLMGSSIDAYKFTSSITLFNGAAVHLNQASDQQKEYIELIEHIRDIFSIISTQGYQPCQYTLKHASYGNNIFQSEVTHYVQAPVQITTDTSKASGKIDNTDKLCQALKTYIQLRGSEPSYWYQGLFTGYSKEQKLKAAFKLYISLKKNDELNDHELNKLIKENGLNLTYLKSKPLSAYLPALKQGRLGKVLAAQLNNQSLESFLVQETIELQSFHRTL